MSHPLAYANQCLYHAGILISAWQHSAQNSEVSETQVALAFAPPVQSKLLDGYGWLLLAACRIRQTPEIVPHSVAQLPALPAGLVHPAEVEACAQLESDGWIAELQAPLEQKVVVRRSNSLAAEQGVSSEQFLHWAERLKALAGQIADGIDES